MTRKVKAMADELKTLGAPDYRQYESIMQARWGRDFNRRTFLIAAEHANRTADASLARGNDGLRRA